MLLIWCVKYFCNQLRFKVVGSHFFRHGVWYTLCWSVTSLVLNQSINQSISETFNMCSKLTDSQLNLAQDAKQKGMKTVK